MPKMKYRFWPIYCLAAGNLSDIVLVRSFHHIGYPRYYRDVLESILDPSTIGFSLGFSFAVQCSIKRGAPCFHLCWGNSLIRGGVVHITRPGSTAHARRLRDRPGGCRRAPGSTPSIRTHSWEEAHKQTDIGFSLGFSFVVQCNITYVHARRQTFTPYCKGLV